MLRRQSLVARPPVRTVHDADRVPERINDGRSCETAPAFGGGRVTVCPVRNEGVERRVIIVGVPVGDGCCCRSRGWCHEGAIHDAQFVLVRTDTELGVGARAGLRTADLEISPATVDETSKPSRRREFRSTRRRSEVVAGALSEVLEQI